MKSKVLKSTLSCTLLTITLLIYSSVPLFAAEWMRYCQHYDTYNVDRCRVQADASCGGDCQKVTFAAGTASCGFCTITFNPFSWCTAASTPTMTAVTSWQTPCEYIQTGSGSESVEWTCSCGSAWVIIGTTTVGCYCN